MKISLRNILFSFMTVVLIGQITVPTVIIASELNSEMFETIATLEDFEENEQGYTLTLESDEEVGVNFEYEVQNDINNFDFNLNDKVLSLDQSNTLVKGENTIKIERKSAEDQLNLFNVNVQKKNIQNLDTQSDVEPLEVVTSETAETTSENSEVSSEEPPTTAVPSSFKTELKTTKPNGYHEALIERNAKYGFDEFVENAWVDNPANTVIDYQNKEIRMLELTSGDYGNANISSYFRLDGAKPFSIGASVEVEQVMEPNDSDILAGDSFSILFSGEANPKVDGYNGCNYGIRPMRNSFAIVWDYYKNETTSVCEADAGYSFQSVKTDSKGNMTKGKENLSQDKYLVSKKTGPRKYYIEVESDGANKLLATAKGNKSWADRYGDPINIPIGPNQTSQDYFVRFVASQGSSKSNVTVSDIEITGDVIHLAKFINETSPKLQPVKWGTSERIALYDANTIGMPQNISVENVQADNFVETANLFFSTPYGGTSIHHNGEKFIDGFTQNVAAETSYQNRTTLTVPNPADDINLQLQLLDDASEQKASLDFDVTYHGFNLTKNFSMEQQIIGEDASIVNKPLYTVNSDVDLNSVSSVKDYLASTDEFMINDPYLTKVTQKQIMDSDRTKVTVSYNQQSNIANVEVSFFGINNVTKTSSFQMAYNDKDIVKTVVDTGIDKNTHDSVKPKKNNMADAGEELEYKISITNRTNKPLTNVVVSDVMDKYIDKNSINSIHITSGTSGFSSSVTNKGVEFKIKNFPAHSTHTITYKVNVKSIDLSQVPEDVIANTVTVTSDGDDSAVDKAVAEIPINKEPVGTIDLKVSKSFINGSDSVDGNNQATTNESLSYKVVLDNTKSTRDLHDVVVTDILDKADTDGTISNLKITDGTHELDPNDYAYSTASGPVLVIVKIPAGAKYVITYDTKTVSKFSDSTAVDNTVTVTSNEITNKISDCASVAKDLKSKHNTKLTKTVVDETANNVAQVGEKLTYTVTLDNQGSAYETNVVLDDKVDDQNLDRSTLRIVSLESNKGTDLSAITDNNLSDGVQLTIPNLAPSEKITLTYSVKVVSGGIKQQLIQNTINNIVGVTTSYYNGTQAQRLTASASITLEEIIDFNVTKTFVENSDSLDGNNLATTNEQLSYEIVLDNTKSSTNLHNVVVRDTLDTMDVDEMILNFKITDGTNELDPSEYAYASPTYPVLIIYNMPAGAKYVITYDIKTVDEFKDDTPVDNTVKVTASGLTTGVTDSVAVEKDLKSKHNTKLTKTVADETANNAAQAGENLTYTITLDNQGSANETNIVLDDKVEDQNLDRSTLQVISLESNQGTDLSTITDNDLSDGIQLNIPNLAPNEKITLTYSVNVVSSGIKQQIFNKTISNTAYVTTSYYDGIKADGLSASSEIDIDVEEIIDLNVTKSFVENSDSIDNNNLATTNETLSYEIVLDNTKSTKDLHNAVVIDTLDITDVDGTIRNFKITDGTNELDPSEYAYTSPNVPVLIIYKIPAGAKYVITYDTKAVAEFSDDSPIDNTVKVTSTEITTGITDSASVDKDLKKVHSTKVSKTVADKTSNDAAQAGEKLTYTVKLKNKGSAYENNIVLDDQVDDQNLDRSTLKIVSLKSNKGTDLSAVTDDDLSDGIQLTIPTLAPGEKITLTYSVKVVNSGIKKHRFIQKTIDNKVNVITSYYDGLGVKGLSAKAKINIDNDAKAMSDLKVTKSFIDGSDSIDGNNLATTNEQLSYEIVLDNSGAAMDQNNVIVTDVLDSKNTTGEIENVQVNDGTTNLAESEYTVDGNIISIVNIPSEAKYTITYDVTTADSFEDDSMIENNVTVVSDDIKDSLSAHESVEKDISAIPGIDAEIAAVDAEVAVSSAPKTPEELLSLLKAKAYDTDGTELTDKIVITDLNGYNYDNPQVDTYNITIGVTGESGKLVRTSVTLKVVADGQAANAIDMLLSSPIYVEKGNGLTDAEVVDDLILPYVLETVDGTVHEPYAITSSNLVSNGGYENDVERTYVFKLVATGEETGLEVEKLAIVVVADDITDLEAVATINAKNIKVLQGSYYGKNVASVMHKESYDVVTAEVNESGTITPVPLTDKNIIASNVNTEELGTYTTTYYFASNDFAIPVNVVRNVFIEVVEANPSENASIISSDNQVQLSDAPTTLADLAEILDVIAVDSSGTDITSEIEIIDSDGYDFSAPAVGTYAIMLGVVGSDGVLVTNIANLTVKPDGTPISGIDMFLSSTVFVENGNGLSDAQVVDELIVPYISETVDGVANSPYEITSSNLVSSGGYQNTVNGTYIFKLAETGKETGLHVERLVPVIVTNDTSDLNSATTIDGKDISIPIGSTYSLDNASKEHADNSDVVTA
ncbi:hypothetical protein RZE82_03550 [Mollicutes bacterium LVI A0039]|nr:hypothetical protein RZE82_03550 [Mollicutes bacterium LVI A0039]